ncbi:winged helix-turn-helix DNA-binding protein [Ruminiclostridium sufflavum DSM 19573]|uniref:Winged helix-turn-helix DNA-binding protein n=1 Tax=Ruminiclostridium sufflavum DSM 19573 TaxID=1121337 RepID=A0A318XIV9_9FIRM|nr:winged helix-turn-helix transcriptional regulator [Ruminiclostridium sufflavum]PYG87160.1 winged helix-turn-helix DNA-binding protein [Ruminiclostridium sufflavum DSM 19573]
MDKKYIVLNEIGKNPEITQRELSKIIRCSVGSINTLLNKMVKEGLIKLKRMPMNRMLYMLTPIGIAEKLQKTSSYIKSNYKYIVETQAKIRFELENLAKENEEVYLIIEEDEISELAKISLKDIANIKFITDKDICDKSKTVVTLSIKNYNRFKEEYTRLINLLELL